MSQPTRSFDKVSYSRFLRFVVIYGSALALILSFFLAGMVMAAGRRATTVCDTPSASYPTIQDAISDSNCTTVNILPGTYNLSSQLEVGRNVLITGAGPSQTILDGGGNGRIFYVYGAANATIREMTIQNGNGQNLHGGGIYNMGDTLLVENVRLINNQADLAGGLINFGDTLTLTNVEISGNQATAQYGGGLHNNSGATLNMTNVTISGNTAAAGGGGMSNSGNVNAQNITIADNDDGVDGAEGINNYGTITITNSIVANSAHGATNCNGNGTFISNGYNIEDKNTCSFNKTGDQANTDPKLNPLADNGGPSYTHALQVSSPAIDAGNNTGCPTTDQRGASRPVDGDGNGTAVCDIGAFEYNGAVPSPTNTPTNTPGLSPTPTETPIPTNTPTNTPGPSPTPTNTPSPSPTPTTNRFIYLPVVLRH